MTQEKYDKFFDNLIPVLLYSVLSIIAACVTTLILTGLFVTICDAPSIGYPYCWYVVIINFLFSLFLAWFIASNLYIQNVMKVRNHKWRNVWIIFSRELSTDYGNSKEVWLKENCNSLYFSDYLNCRIFFLNLQDATLYKLSK